MVIDLGEWDVKKPMPVDWKMVIWQRLIGFHIEDQNIRDPKDHRNLHKNVYEWHQDCNGRQTLMLIWANRYPTEVQGEVTLPKHIYLLENDLHFHRTPAVVRSDPDRWFCRALGTMPYVS